MEQRQDERGEEGGPSTPRLCASGELVLILHTVTDPGHCEKMDLVNVLSSRLGKNEVLGLHSA